MEIHAPQGPILSLKEFFVHIGIVTIGILIALSLEGLLEWRHHRELVEEARANIASEIRDNRKELEDFLNYVPKLQKDEMNVVQFINDILAHPKTDTHGNLNLNFIRSEIGNTSWTTAQTVGAPSFMDYSEVKRYARVYQLQDEFLHLQEKNTDAVISAITMFAENKNPAELPAADLRIERNRVLESLAGIRAQQQIGQELIKRYSEALSK